jgi:hypothetical protein
MGDALSSGRVPKPLRARGEGCGGGALGQAAVDEEARVVNLHTRQVGVYMCVGRCTGGSPPPSWQGGRQGK